jgi:hypothetical protein
MEQFNPTHCHLQSSQPSGGRLQMAMWSQMVSRPENISPKGVFFSDLICNFAMPVVGFSFLQHQDK